MDAWWHISFMLITESPENLVAPRRKRDGVSKTPHRDCWAWAGWEPDRFYRRSGANFTYYFGNGSWIADWRKQLENPETLRRVQKLGVTTLVTRFFKGFGPKTEAAEWEQTRTFVQQARHLGLKVWGYVQGGRLFGETLFLERPEAREWPARTADGRKLTWGTSYFRFMPCLNNPEYLLFLKEILEQGIWGLEFDGLSIDNNYYLGCYCRRCEDTFREWLNQRPDLETLTGLRDAGAVSPPSLQSPETLITDPLQMLWIAFNVETRHRFYDALYRHLKKLRKDAPLCANPAFPRNLSSRRNLSFDPSREATHCDFLFAENGNQPGWRTRMASQAEAHLLAEAGGYRTLSSSWHHDPEAWRHGKPAANLPESAAGIWTGLAEEFSHASALLGNNWMLRPGGDLGNMLMDVLPEHSNAFRQAMAFFRDLETQVNFPDRRTWAEIGVLLNPSALSLCGQSTGDVSRAVMRYLQLRRRPFRILYSATDATPEMHHIIACHQLCLSNGERDALLAFARKPERSVLLLGDSGRHNEWFVPRNETDWFDFTEKPGVRHFPLALPSASSAANAHLATDTYRVRADLKTALDAALLNSGRRIQAPFQILVNREIGEDGRHFVHLRDQSEKTRTISGARVFVGDLDLKDLLVFSLSNGRMRRSAPCNDSGWIELPDFENYCLLVGKSG